MKKIDRALLILKYMLYVLMAFLIILVWVAVFIIQGGIGLGMSFYFIPITLLPILLFSTIASWLLLKMFDYKKKVVDKKKVSLIAGVFVLVLSVLFQHFIVSKRMTPFVFENEKFSHIEMTNTLEDIKKRMLISANEVSKIVLPETIETDSSSLMINMTIEAVLIFQFREFLSKENISNTCKSYLNIKGGYKYCILDFQKDVYSKYKFSSTGNILLLAMGAASLFEAKKIMKSQFKDDDLYFSLLITNGIIESCLLSAQENKDTLMNKNNIVRFTFGYELKPGSITAYLEQKIIYKSLYTFIERIEQIVAKIEKKLATSTDETEQMKIEEERFKRLRDEFKVFQKDGYTIEELKTKEQEIHLSMAENSEEALNNGYLKTMEKLILFSLPNNIEDTPKSL